MGVAGKFGRQPITDNSGFVLMSSHREAVEAMHQMHGKWIE